MTWTERRVGNPARPRVSDKSVGFPRHTPPRAGPRHLVDTLRAKKQLFFLPPSQNLLRAGHVPVGCISFKLAQWLPRPLARLHSWRVAMH